MFVQSVFRVFVPCTVVFNTISSAYYAYKKSFSSLALQSLLVAFFLSDLLCLLLLASPSAKADTYRTLIPGCGVSRTPVKYLVRDYGTVTFTVKKLNNVLLPENFLL